MSSRPLVDIESIAQQVAPKRLFDLPSLAPPALADLEELSLTPRAIVPGLLFADLRLRIAPGGVGKTTLALFEAMQLALRRPLWGHWPAVPGNTVIISREDPRGILLARLRELMRHAGLSDSERAEVLQRVRILDLSSLDFRLAAVVGDVVLPNRLAIEELLQHVTADGWMPDWMIFDPAISLGVGETRVNDSEQGLIEAGRLIRNELNCCVEFIHHSGKQNARESTLDQYSGRGGSAFADGARMVAVLQPQSRDAWQQATGQALGDTETGLVMALAKTSYSPPCDPLYIRRDGWRFEQVSICPMSPERRQAAADEQVMQFLQHEASQGRHYSQKDLGDMRDQLGMTRNEIVAACARLRAAGRAHVVGQNGKKTYLEPFPPSAGRVGDFEGLD